jgi:hypothetical protein
MIGNGPKTRTQQSGGSSSKSELSSVFDSSSSFTPLHLEHRYLPSIASTSVENPRYEPPLRDLICPVTPHSISEKSWIDSQYNSNSRETRHLPTPPSSPYLFTSGHTSPHVLATQQNIVPYSPLSAANSSITKTISPSFVTPISRVGSAFDGRLIKSSATQLTERHKSPCQFVKPPENGIDPFIDQSNTLMLHEHPTTFPSNSLAINNLFKPSRALLDLPRSVDPDLAFMARRVGIDLQGNYKGDITKEHIYNAVAPVCDNCALHIIGLPADVSLKEIFAVIVGKVFSFQLHAPVPGKWNGCGARLVFTTRAATDDFYHKARTGLGIAIRGHQIRVLWNRDPCRPQHHADRHQSRILQIKGPDVGNFSAEGIERFFASKLLFNLVERKEWPVSDGKKVVELHFPSILGQSRPAMKQFYEMLDETEQRHNFMIQYAPDPCDPAGRADCWWGGRRF